MVIYSSELSKKNKGEVWWPKSICELRYKVENWKLVWFQIKIFIIPLRYRLWRRKLYYDFQWFDRLILLCWRVDQNAEIRSSWFGLGQEYLHFCKMKKFNNNYLFGSVILPYYTERWNNIFWIYFFGNCSK